MKVIQAVSPKMALLGVCGRKLGCCWDSGLASCTKVPRSRQKLSESAEWRLPLLSSASSEAVGCRMACGEPHLRFRHSPPGWRVAELPNWMPSCPRNAALVSRREKRGAGKLTAIVQDGLQRQLASVRQRSTPSGSPGDRSAAGRRFQRTAGDRRPPSAALAPAAQLELPWPGCVRRSRRQRALRHCPASASAAAAVAVQTIRCSDLAADVRACPQAACASAHV